MILEGFASLVGLRPTIHEGIYIKVVHLGALINSFEGLHKSRNSKIRETLRRTVAECFLFGVFESTFAGERGRTGGKRGPCGCVAGISSLAVPSVFLCVLPDSADALSQQ
jgi:hypothetical protein